MMPHYLVGGMEYGKGNVTSHVLSAGRDVNVTRDGFFEPTGCMQTRPPRWCQDPMGKLIKKRDANKRNQHPGWTYASRKIIENG
jgi:hypothetical protein